MPVSDHRHPMDKSPLSCGFATCQHQPHVARAFELYYDI